MLAAGTVVSDFRVEALLGEGGMAMVYEAHQVSLDRTVALKVLASRLGDDPGFRERFRRECQIQARLDHPHIVPIHAAGNSDYGLWLAMRLVRGPTLREVLLAERLSPARALGLLAPIAAALDVAHESGLIHRDITPQNILIERNEHPYLSDFGITRGRGDRSLTQTGQFLGTLDYVAPEQIRDEPTTATADIYSLGAVLFECLAGRVPFDKNTDTAVLWAHVHEDPPEASRVDASLPKALDPVLGKALAKRPGDRYTRASDLIADAVKALDPPRSRPAPPAEREGRERRSLRLVALIASLAIGLTALSFGAMSSGNAGTDTRRVVSGDLAVDVPRSWTVSKVRESPIEGLPLEDPAVLSAGQGQTVTIGMSEAIGKSLLPRGLRSPGDPDGEPVALGDLEALRYPDLSSQGPGLAAFVVPTEGGVATVSCRPGARRPSFFEACQRLASTLDLVEVKAFPLGPSPAFADGLRRRLTVLHRRRARLTKRLAAAGTADGQAAVASDLGTAFRRAARGLASLSVTPQSAGGQASVVGGLRGVHDAYRALAAAAAREDAAGYTDAARTVGRAEDRVDRRLQGLEQLGYRVEG
jgi:serine/threonine protein kinase